MATSYHLRVAETLFNVHDLDSVRLLYISSNNADRCPRLQQAVRVMVEDEEKRRAGEIDGRAMFLPDYSSWLPEDWITAGVVVQHAAECAAASGEPTITDFAFRMANWWLLEFAKANTVELPA